VEEQGVEGRVRNGSDAGCRHTASGIFVQGAVNPATCNPLAPAGGSRVVRALHSRYHTRKRWVQAGGRVI